MLNLIPSTILSAFRFVYGFWEALPPIKQFSSKHHLNFLATENKSYIMQVENVVLFPHSQILAPPKPSWEAETQFRIWIFREL